MFRYVLAVALAWSGSANAHDEATVAHLSAQLDTSIAAGDADSAAAYYCDDFVLNSGSGRLKTKSDMLADVSNQALHLEINHTDEVVVRQTRDVAVLMGRLRQKGQLGAQSFDQRLRVTDTWIRGGAHGWCLFAAHASVIAG